MGTWKDQPAWTASMDSAVRVWFGRSLQMARLTSLAPWPELPVCRQQRTQLDTRRLILSGYGSKRTAQGLDDRLHAAEQFVDCDSGMEFVDFDDHNVFSLGRFTRDAEHAP